MKKNKIPTIIGIILLIIGVAAGVLLVQSQQIFRLGASPEETPKDVRITNVGDNSFTVSWVTDAQTGGFVKYGESEGSLDRTKLDEITDQSSVHYTTVKGLNPQTTYFFKINSGGTDYDNNGVAWQVTTGTDLGQPRETKIVSGSVFTPSGNAVQNAIVYADAGGATTLSTITSQKGNFLIPISAARTKDLNSFATVDSVSTLVEISVEAGPQGVATAQIYPQSANPAPAIILGQSHDFRNLEPSESNEIPEVDLNLPDSGERPSGFEVDEETGGQTSESVTIDSLDEGETITSTRPEFFGEGPPGTQITITVESNHEITETLSISSNGNWSWSPPDNLEEGTHTITITWRDAGGILRTLTRNFVVQAAEDDPSFEATPSATTSPTPSPTPTPTTSPTPSPTATATSSPEPLPDAGSLTPTLALTIMGLGLLFLSGTAAYLAFDKE